MHVRDAECAASLAARLSDEALWTLFELAPTSALARERLAATAHDVYAQSAPFLEEALGDDAPFEEVERLLYASVALRSIGDHAAIWSHEWTHEQWPDWSSAPRPRPVIEAGIRLFDVDDWADSLGRRLSLQTPEGVPDEMWPSEEAAQHGLDVDIPSAVASSLRAYGRLVEGLHRPETRARLRSAKFQEMACGLLASSRHTLRSVWGNLPAEAGYSALAIVFMAQGYFVISVPYHREDSFFPSLAFLRSFFEESGALDWLIAEGADLPAWVLESTD